MKMFLEQILVWKKSWTSRGITREIPKGIHVGFIGKSPEEFEKSLKRIKNSRNPGIPEKFLVEILKEFLEDFLQVELEFLQEFKLFKEYLKKNLAELLDECYRNGRGNFKKISMSHLKRFL